MSIEKEIAIQETNDPLAKEEFKYKIIVVGDSGVGKTNLIQRFINNSFSHDTKATVGVEFKSKNFLINNEIFNIEIWDTAGQERYKSITSTYYKGAKAGILIYDVTNKKTFDNIDKWRNEIREKSDKGITLMMIGNKTDLKDKIAVTSEMGMEKAKIFEMPLMETSALDASNVKGAFELIMKEIYKKTFKAMSEIEGINEGIEQMNKDNAVKINSKEKSDKDKEGKKKCC